MHPVWASRRLLYPALRRCVEAASGSLRAPSSTVRDADARPPHNRVSHETPATRPPVVTAAHGELSPPYE